MLEALETGVKGGRWYSLVDKVSRPANLRAAWEQVKRNEGAPGVDHVTIEMFERRLEENLERLASDLASGSYEAQAIRRVYIPKPGRPGEQRPLGIPTVRDRVAQAAVRHVLEPIFEAGFAEHSYGFRPGRGTKGALRHVRRELDGGLTHVVDADLKSYFDTIPHDRLMERLASRVADRKVLTIVERWLHQKITEDLTEWTPDGGTPQGAVLSPLLANLYLDELDHLVAASGFSMVRYADDFVILCRTRADAERALALVREWTASAGLTLHPDKTRVVDLDVGESFDFLGYSFRTDGHWLSRRSLRNFRDRIRELTPRVSGRSLKDTISKVNPTLTGWYQYFKHINAWMLGRLDGWVRTRLRAILWRFEGRRGYAKGSVAQRWPNVYFERLGLFSLAGARRSEVAQLRLPLQPARR